MASPLDGTGTRGDDPEERDPGLARERTELAWTRTAISFAAVGAAILKTSPLTGGVVVALSAAIWAVGRVAARSARHPRVVSSASRRRTLQVTAAATTAVSLAALVVALLSPSHALR